MYLGAQIAMIAAYVLPFYGLCSLYVYLAGNDRVERTAFIGMVTSLMGTALALPPSGIFAFVAPVVGISFLQNQVNVSQLFIDSVTGPSAMVGILSAILYTLVTHFSRCGYLAQ
jgi:polyferredoxin